MSGLNDNDILFDYLDGTLSPEQRRAFEERLAVDEELRAELEAQRALDRLLQSSATPPPPPDLRRNIRQRLEREVFTPRVTMQNRLYRFAQMAALVAVLLVGVQAYRMMSVGKQEAQDDEFSKSVAELDERIKAEETPLVVAQAPVKKEIQELTPPAVEETMLAMAQAEDAPVEAKPITIEPLEAKEKESLQDTSRDQAMEALRPIETPVEIAFASPTPAPTPALTPPPTPSPIQPLFVPEAPRATPEMVPIEPLYTPEPTPPPQIAMRSPADAYSTPQSYGAPSAAPSPAVEGAASLSMAERFSQIPGVRVTQKPAPEETMVAAAPPGAAATLEPRESFGQTPPTEQPLRSRALQSLVEKDTSERPEATATPALDRALYQVPKSYGTLGLIAKQRPSESSVETLSRVQDDVRDAVQRIGGQVQDSKTRTMADGRRLREITALVPSARANDLADELKNAAGYDYRRSLDDQSLGRALEKGQASALPGSGIAFFERRAPRSIERKGSEAAKALGGVIADALDAKGARPSPNKALSKRASTEIDRVTVTVRIVSVSAD